MLMQTPGNTASRFRLPRSGPLSPPGVVTQMPSRSRCSTTEIQEQERAGKKAYFTLEKNDTDCYYISEGTVE